VYSLESDLIDASDGDASEHVRRLNMTGGSCCFSKLYQQCFVAFSCRDKKVVMTCVLPVWPDF
jgi:hypothetical protein